MGEETAHHIVVEKLVFFPVFNICLGCLLSCILKDCNFSLQLELSSFRGDFPCMFFATEWFESDEAKLKHFGILFCF